MDFRKSRAPKGEWQQLAKEVQGEQLPINKERMQRRMSVKLTEHEAESAPPLPSNAAKIVQAHQPEGRERSRTVKREETLANLFSKPNFSVESFINGQLGNASASKISDFSSHLEGLSDEVHQDMKATVNKSYREIIKVNADVVDTETRLKQLKTCLKNINETVSQLKEVAERRIEMEEKTKHESRSAARSNMEKRKDRSSVLLVEQMWSSQMATLFKNVEGAQRVISPIPGRHIVAESARWYELNATTWRPLQPAHLFILNDHILVGAKKRKNETSSSSKSLVVSHCWALRDVRVVEVSMAKEERKRFTINIKQNTMSFIYQTDREDEYRKVLQSYRSAKDELRNLVEREKAKQSQLRDSMSRLSQSARKSQLLQDLSVKMHSRSRSLDLMQENRTTHSMGSHLRKLDVSCNDLDVSISHNKYTESVGHILRLRKEVSKNNEKLCHLDKMNEDVILNNIIAIKVNERSAIAVEKLTYEVENNQLDQFDSQELIDYMTLFEKLNVKDAGRRCLLSSKAKFITQLINGISFDGNIPSYIVQASLIRFSIIIKTVVLYTKCFAEMSYVVTWATEQFQVHIELLKRQLLGVKVDDTSFKQCIKLTEREAAKMRLVGVDLGFLLDDFYMYLKGL